MAILLAALLLVLCPLNALAATFGLPVPPNTCPLGCLFNRTGCSYQPGYHHAGIDYYQPPSGPCEILATADGTVAALYWNGPGDDGMGNAVVLRHRLASGGEVFSLYGHLNSFAPGLAEGDNVMKGEVVGLMGGSGFGYPTYWGPHLHFELKSAPTCGNPGSPEHAADLHQGFMPTSATDWGYYSPSDYIDRIDFVAVFEYLNQPGPPMGPAEADMNQPAEFRSGYAECSFHHEDVQYQFAWGDGTQTDWLSSPTATHTWTARGDYVVAVRARCAVNPGIVSSWNTSPVEIVRPSPVFTSLPLPADIQEGQKAQLLIVATDPLGDPMTINPEGEAWPRNCWLEDVAPGKARIVFWPDYYQGADGGVVFRLGIKATNGETSATATVVCAVHDVPDVMVLNAGEIGPDGGTMTGGDGLLKVDFPVGSLADVEQVTLSEARTSYFANLPSGQYGPVVGVGPPGCGFGVPVRVTLHYNGSGPKGPETRLFHCGGGSWKLMPEAAEVVVNANSRTVSFWATEAGFFAASSLTPPPPPDQQPAEDDSGGGGSGGGCFFATAAWGSGSAAQVECLRRMRDTYLLANGPGRYLVGLYYRLSPPAAGRLATSPTLRQLARGMLWPVYLASWAWLKLGTMALGFLLGLISLGLLSGGLTARSRLV